MSSLVIPASPVLVLMLDLSLRTVISPFSMCRLVFSLNTLSISSKSNRTDCVHVTPLGSQFKSTLLQINQLNSSTVSVLFPERKCKCDIYLIDKQWLSVCDGLMDDFSYV